MQEFCYVSTIVFYGTTYVLLLNTFLHGQVASTSVLPFLKLSYVSWKSFLCVLAGLTEVVTFAYGASSSALSPPVPPSIQYIKYSGCNTEVFDCSFLVVFIHELIYPLHQLLTVTYKITLKVPDLYTINLSISMPVGVTLTLIQLLP